MLEVITHPDGTVTERTVPDPPNQVNGLSWEGFRKLFTDAELEGLDSFEDGTITLTTAQKRKIKVFIEKGKARGQANSLDVTTAGMGAAIDFLEARGFIASGRKAEIVAGKIRS